MKKRLSRWLFVTRTRLSVAASNHAVERAFGGIFPEPGRVFTQHYARIAGSVLLAGIVAGVMSVGRGPSLNIRRAKEAAAPVAGLSSPNMPVISNGRFSPPFVREPQIPFPAPEPGYALAVDKSRKILFVLAEQADHYRVIKEFDISLGKIIGTKQRAGDMRTPSGFYKIVKIKDGKELPAYYGPRAFVTDYPNRFDQANGRTGGGIWLHGTGTGGRTQDTHGCVVLDDNSLKTLGTWVRIDTPIAIYPENFHLPVKEGKVDKKYLSTDFFYGDTRRASNG